MRLMHGWRDSFFPSAICIGLWKNVRFVLVNQWRYSRCGLPVGRILFIYWLRRRCVKKTVENATVDQQTQLSRYILWLCQWSLMRAMDSRWHHAGQHQFKRSRTRWILVTSFLRMKSQFDINREFMHSIFSTTYILIPIFTFADWLTSTSCVRASHRNKKHLIQFIAVRSVLDLVQRRHTQMTGMRNERSPLRYATMQCRDADTGKWIWKTIKTGQIVFAHRQLIGGGCTDGWRWRWVVQLKATKMYMRDKI